MLSLRLPIQDSYLTLPLFQGGQLDATLRQTKAVYEEAVAKYRQTVLTAFAEVENNLIERTSVRLLNQQLVSVAALIKSLEGGCQAPENSANDS
jgi:outer membrane protein, multidrug efflux system